MLPFLVSAALASPSATGVDLGVDFGPAASLRSCAARMEVDVGLDTQVDWVWFYRFDREGRLRKVDGEARVGIGTPRMEYWYDDLDQLTVQTWDGDSDGRTDRRIDYAYGPEGLERSQEHSEQQAGPSQTWFVSERGRVVRVETDLDNDGALDIASTQHWVDDRVVRVDLDDDDDGALDAATYYAYDGFGRLESTRYDFGADGFIDRESSEVWGPADRLAERIRDDDADGRPDSRTTVWWACPGG